MQDFQETNTEVLPNILWNKGRLIGPKPSLQPKHVWAIRTHLQLEGKSRDLCNAFVEFCRSFTQPFLT